MMEAQPAPAPDGRRSILPGLFLIFLGIYLLAHKLDWIDLDWIHIYPILFLFAAARSFSRYLQFEHSNSLFSAVFLGSLGLFFTLRNYEILPFWPIETAWPVFLVAAGLGFAAMYIRHSRNLFDLLVSLFLIALGLVIFLNNLSLLQAQFLADLWPVIFILIGLALIRNSMKRSKDKEAASQSLS